ncbi:MAG TPA: DUF4157 domain-containing protein [Longimicrobium sp.]
MPIRPRAAGMHAKLRVTSPHDPAEREADQISEQVMRMPAPGPTGACGAGECGAGAPNGGPAQLLRAVAAPGPTAGPGPVAPAIVRDVLGAPGRSLDAPTRAFLEPRFGRDFRDVRIHTDARAEASAEAVGARAYTVGAHVVFAPGQYAPGTDHGRRLLAHELTHVVQQSAGAEARVARVPTESGARDGRYTFSTRCGWIDWGHANSGLTLQLIQRVQQASDALRAAGTAATATTGQMTTPAMTARAAGIVLSSSSVRVRLLRPLSATEVHEVALSIFKTLSIAFETQQLWTDLIGASSFAQEDLPSNLLAFYMAVRGFGRPDITRMCGGMNETDSVAEYQRNHNFVQNRSFAPVGATEAWPAELSTINDGAAAALYETERVFATQGSDAFSFCPMYRVVGSIGERDFFLFSTGGARFTEADDVRVVPTFHAHPTTSGQYGHVNLIQILPARPADETRFRNAGLQWPLEVPEPVLRCLTSHGNPG